MFVFRVIVVLLSSIDFLRPTLCMSAAELFLSEPDSLQDESYQRASDERRDLAVGVLGAVEAGRAQNRDPRQRNCSRGSLMRWDIDLSLLANATLGAHTKPAIRAANLLNSILTSGTDSEPQCPHNEELYYALARSLVELDPVVGGAGIAFRRGAFSSDDPTGLFGSYVQRSEEGTIRNVDLDEAWEEAYDNRTADGTEWFWRLEATFAKSNGTTPSQLLNTSYSDTIWAPPYVDCGLGDTWVIPFSVPFFVIQGKNRVFKGVVLMTFNLDRLDVNQCSEEDGTVFAGTHRCDKESMECIPIHGLGFRLGSYTCSCRPGYYYPQENATNSPIFNGSLLEDPLADEPFPDPWRCLPCRPGCASCYDDSPCFVEYDIFLRGLPLGFQSFCMTIAIVIGITVFRLRKTKTIATGMWTMLETILLGSLLLYATVVIRYFEPNLISCLMEPWFRELGFATCYGAIILKMYKILVEFRTRKAHRWVVRDKDLLKYLSAILLVVTGYMAAWTVINLYMIQEGHSLLDIGHTEDGLKYFICKSIWWEYVTEIAELLFMVFGIYMSYHMRNASSAFKEKRYLCLTIYIETMVSLTLHILRHLVWLELDPDYIFLMYFTRCQLTVTITLFLIFAPKLWYYHKPPRDAEPDHRPEQGPHETVKLQDGVTSNGEVDIGDINLADMDPEDIRAELRRVYTQLQILRNKTMRKDNPHISKRKGGRKATHRRFSLQAFHHRHRHHPEPEPEPEASKTPEDSTASGDASTPAPTAQPDPAIEQLPASTPTVSFKGVQK